MKTAASRMWSFSKKIGIWALLLVCAAALFGCSSQTVGRQEETGLSEAASGTEETAVTEAEMNKETMDEIKEQAEAESKAQAEAEAESKAKTEAKAKKLLALPAGSALIEEDVQEVGEDAFFSIEEIDDALFDRMYGKSFKEYCTVPREDLRYIRCLHKNAEGDIMIGELVVNYRIAEDIRDIFHELYDASFPIEKMHLVDDYEASDDLSMEDDNTSCFNFRVVAGTDQLSNHAYGLAIDINPYYNVYYIPSADYVSPASAYQYKDRDADFDYKVEPGDLCYELFTEHGFDWGGWWDYAKDYQHFEKPLSSFEPDAEG